MAEEKKKGGFERLHEIVKDRPDDRAMRVDRGVLTDCLYEMLACAGKVEDYKKQLKTLKAKHQSDGCGLTAGETKGTE